MSASPPDFDAAAALANVRSTRTELLSRHKGVRWPWSRHAAVAGLISGYVAAIAAPPLVNAAIDLLLVAATGLVIAADKMRTGVWVNGWRPGPTRPIAIAITVAYIALALAAWWLKYSLGLWWAPLLGAVVLFPIALFGSKLWELVYRDELRGAA